MTVVEDLLLRLQTMGFKEGAAEVEGTAGAIKKSDVAAKDATASHVGLGKSFGTLKSLAFSAGGMLGVGALAVSLGESVKNAEALQESQRQLGNAITQNVHKPAKDATARMTEFADSLSTAGGFVPTDELQSMTTLVRATDSVSKAQKDMKLSTDLARGGHMDLARATRAVAMVEQEHTAGLTRLGIALPTVKTAEEALVGSTTKVTEAQRLAAKQQDLNATRTEDMRILIRRFGGDTQTYSRTAAGAMTNLANTVEILATNLGKMLLPIVTTVAQAVSKFVRQMMTGKGAGGEFVDVLKGLWSTFKDIFNVLKPLWPLLVSITAAWLAYKVVTMAVAAVDIVQSLIATVTALGEALAASESLTAGMAALDISMDANPIGLMVAAVVALVGVFVLAYKHVKLFRDIVNTAWSWIKKNWPTLLAIFTGPLAPIVLMVEHFNLLKKTVTSVVDWIEKEFGRLLSFMGSLPGKVAGVVKKIPIIGGAISAGSSIVHGVSSFLGGLQGGGHVGQSGPYLVGERGPEVVTLPRGAHVTPNEALGHGGDQREHVIVIYNMLDGKKISQSVIRQGLLQQSRGG